jgi:hypothetical protein
LMPTWLEALARARALDCTVSAPRRQDEAWNVTVEADVGHATGFAETDAELPDALMRALDRIEELRAQRG